MKKYNATKSKNSKITWNLHIPLHSGIRFRNLHIKWKIQIYKNVTVV